MRIKSFSVKGGRIGYWNCIKGNTLTWKSNNTRFMTPMHFFVRFYNRSRTLVSQHPGMFAGFSILATTVLGKFRLRFLLFLAFIINIFYGLKTGIGIIMSRIGNQLILFFYESGFYIASNFLQLKGLPDTPLCHDLVKLLQFSKTWNMLEAILIFLILRGKPTNTYKAGVAIEE
ncbi:hypothetical protein ES705_44876 [subsurface metagenome]